MGFQPKEALTMSKIDGAWKPLATLLSKIDGAWKPAGTLLESQAQSRCQSTKLAGLMLPIPKPLPHIGKLGEYELHEEIGRGSYACVHRATQVARGKTVAVKKIEYEWTSEHRQRVEMEIANQRLVLEGVVKIVDVYEVSRDTYVVMEYLGGGDLFEYIQSKEGMIPEEKAWDISRQLIFAVECCHTSELAHLDLKPENVVRNERGNWKLCDFGSSRTIGEGTLVVSDGTPEYAAPETFKPHEGYPADIYSCGKILELLCSSFASSSGSDDVRDLIGKMLEKDPRKRISLQDIEKHRWFVESPSQRRIRKLARRAVSTVGYVGMSVRTL